ncbi:MAG: CocE/NonD family hydrolase [Pseudomonadota bacterium]|nr:CocE/NonD family hydrolase [Pseudomonadota bacterium]
MTDHPARFCSVVEHRLIPLSDGRRLACRLWLPHSSESTPVPAILEYLPYRKRDGTSQRDEATYPGLAAVGYAGVRVDISGTGESDGEFDDEYSPRELADGVEVIEWIAAQDWCDGNIGMMGISWGGFNSLQIAALKPPALKAVIAIGATVDRYNDDIHYKNGCLLYSNFWWSSVMLCYTSRPPDPLLVGDSWRRSRLKRLQTQPFPLEKWLAHQRRDDYWRHGSVCECYEAMTVPALVISGWADGYVNAPPAAAAHFPGKIKAINGPWVHQYPHFAYPHPRMDFVAEARRWWDRWLKGIENDAESLPAYRAYISENVRPGPWREHEAGRWVAENTWPSETIQAKTYYPEIGGRLSLALAEEATASICSPLDCGTASGEYFTLKPDSELAGDQRPDDAGSLLFDSERLTTAVEILGRPVMGLRVSIDRPIGLLAIRLLDVHPDGTSFRVSWGVVNLTHRKANDRPEPMVPDQAVDIQVRLDECGYRFLPGHSIRIAISTAYWPMVMPPPQITTATVHLGRHCVLELPERNGTDTITVTAPTVADPLPEYPLHSKADYQRRVERDLQNQVTRLQVIDDTGEIEIPGHSLHTRHRHEDCWTIDLNDPLSARATSRYICWMNRDDWTIRTESDSSIECDEDSFHVRAKVTAFENDQVVSKREWLRSIPRDLM